MPPEGLARSGLLIAAPRSGSGKTVLTLAIARALKRNGLTVSPAKAGPDYIDPSFHAVAAGNASVNLDPWAMRPSTLARLVERPGLLLVEAAMGLFDAATDGSGSAADLAARLRLPVVLVLDCAGTSHSIAALLRGFATHRPDVRIAGVIANRVASERHETMVQAGLQPVLAELAVEYLGAVPRTTALNLPERHLGLVPAGEHEGIERFVERAADLVADAVDLDRLVSLATTPTMATGDRVGFPPIGSRIAVASDVAFAFAYPHLLDAWHEAGASLHPFSPLADEAPDEAAHAVFLPGGYPELHAGRIAAAGEFRAGMEAASRRGAWIYGECGGYMSMGERLVDADGITHPMLGLLPLETSFAERRLHLGYRNVSTLGETPFGPNGAPFAAHEFHHASIRFEGEADRAFRSFDAEGNELGSVGLRVGRAFGSFLHLIDRR